jgi:hypothetical protein
VRGGFGAVCGAERVHHEYIAQRGHLFSQLVAVFLFAFVEAHIL